MEKEVLFDTNFLTLPVQFKIDIFAEAEKLVPDAKFVTLVPVVNELKKLDTKAARFGMQILPRVEIKEASGKADNAIVDYAEKNNAIVCTNDKELKERCLEKKISVIFMRKQKILELKEV